MASSSSSSGRPGFSMNTWDYYERVQFLLTFPRKYPPVEAQEPSRTGSRPSQASSLATEPSRSAIQQSLGSTKLGSATMAVLIEHCTMAAQWLMLAWRRLMAPLGH